MDFIVDDEDHDERRVRWAKVKKVDNDKIEIDADVYNKIVKCLYKLDINDIRFIDGNKFNLKADNILVKYTKRR